MKTKLIVFLSAMLSAFSLHAQEDIYCTDECARQSISINTGYNHAAANEYNFGERDEYWQVVQVPAGGGATDPVPFCAYVIEPDPTFWTTDYPNPAISQYISVFPTTINSFNNWTGGCPGSPMDNPYRLQRKFNICTPNDQAQVRIDLEMMVDDLIEKVWVDGTLLATFPCATGNFAYVNRDIMSVVVNLAPGQHTISMDMRNIFGGVMGVNAQGNITVIDGVSSVTDPNCFGKNSCSCFDDQNMEVEYLGTDEQGNCLYKATVNTSSSNTIVGYEWSIIGNNAPSVVHISSASSDSYYFSLPAGASVTLRVVIHAVKTDFGPGEDPCCAATLEQEVFCEGGGTEIPPCEGVDGVLEATFMGGSAATGCRFRFTATVFPPSGYTVQSYTWSVPGNPSVTNVTTATSNNYTYTVPNNTGVTVTVEIILITPDGTQCKLTLQRNVECIDGQGVAYRQENTTGVNSNIPQGIQIYPNPVDNTLHISMPENISTVTITDVTGRVVAALNVDGQQQITIPMETYAKGTYLININNKHTKVITKE